MRINSLYVGIDRAGGWNVSVCVRPVAVCLPGHLTVKIFSYKTSHFPCMGGILSLPKKGLWEGKADLLQGISFITPSSLAAKQQSPLGKFIQYVYQRLLRDIYSAADFIYRNRLKGNDPSGDGQCYLSLNRPEVFLQDFYQVFCWRISHTQEGKMMGQSVIHASLCYHYIFPPKFG